MERIPVYQIPDFRFDNRYFYANKLEEHIAAHGFIEKSHRHDFYLALLCTKGTGIHEIDFKTYPVSRGSVFLMSPGQVHRWELSADVEGYIFFHSEEFYKANFAHKNLEEYPFFSQIQHSPLLQLENTGLKSIDELFEKMLNEYKAEDTGLKGQLLVTLTDLLYLEISRFFLVGQPLTSEHSPAYAEKLRQLKKLINEHFKTIKSPQEYADMMNMTSRHLNRICNEMLGKTTTELIAERIVLEAKRMLIHAGKPVKEIADNLGFDDPSYFIRFFKKQSGETPASFVNRQKGVH